MTPVTPEEWRAYKDAKLSECDPGVVARAVAVLRQNIRQPTIDQLRERIAENPVRWISGRDSAPCYFCTTGDPPVSDLGPRPCPVCHDTRVAHEMSLHHTFGMWVRNLLRKNGITDDMVPDGNLDDYYAQFVELALVPPADPPQLLTDYRS